MRQEAINEINEVLKLEKSNPKAYYLKGVIYKESGDTSLAVSSFMTAIEQDPKVAGRLALWGRRLMGEMISQATLVAGSRPALQELFLRPPAGETAMTATELTAMVNRLTVGHAKRMDVLGLAS
jgi:tetratricopeptide (TPR) repeat protein